MTLQPTQYNPPTQIVVVQEQKQVGIAYLLLLFFGILGAHKFYLGRPGVGVLYLVTLGFLGFGCLIDLFTLGSQVRSQNAADSARIMPADQIVFPHNPARDR